MHRFFIYPTPIGPCAIAENNRGLTHLTLAHRLDTSGMLREPSPLLQAAYAQLLEYLEGRRRAFSLPLDPDGTPFQRTVWEALCRIPYGQARTYGQIARDIGNPTACRAVGMANHRNPILIVVPCHRVVGANGRLTGYACGLELKQRLLELEGAIVPSS